MSDIEDRAPAYYSMRQMVEFTGAKRSQIENWVRSRVLVPHVASTGTGIARRYTFEALLACAVAVELNRYRIPSPEIKNVVHFLLSSATSRRKSDVIQSWQTFIDPQRRFDERVSLIYAPESGVPWIWLGAVELDVDTYLVVDLSRILPRLEAITDDWWIPLRRPTRPRRRHRRT
jgi:hypothetical protein